MKVLLLPLETKNQDRVLSKILYISLLALSLGEAASFEVFNPYNNSWQRYLGRLETNSARREA